MISGHLAGKQQIFLGIIQRDYRKVAEVHLIAGLVPNNVPIDDLAQALRSIGEPIFGQSVKDISGGKLLKQLFDVTEKFNMQTQPQLLMLQKTIRMTEIVFIGSSTTPSRAAISGLGKLMFIASLKSAVTSLISALLKACLLHVNTAVI